MQSIFKLFSFKTNEKHTGVTRYISRNLLFIMGGVFFVFIVGFVFNPFSKKHPIDEGFTDSNSPTFVMYYANWCGHCKTLKPQFEKLIESYKGNVQIKMVDAETHPVETINSYPTLRFYPKGETNDQFEDYKGNRDLNSLTDFVYSKSP